MKIVYFGNNIRGVKCLETLHSKGFCISAVVVHHGARDEKQPHSVFNLAKSLSIPVFDPKNVNASDFLSALQGLGPELMILSGYNQILKRDILSIPSKGVINLHGGRLPYYRGGSPINWQIINGEVVGGCAILYVDEGIDTGDIIAQELYPIGPNETAGDIIEKTLEIFPRLLVNTVNQIECETVLAEEQNHTKACYYSKRYPHDGIIKWDTMNALMIHNLVRGLNGESLPGAFSYFKGQKIKIWRTKLFNKLVKGPPGRIALKEDEGVVVIAADRGILVTEIKIETDEKIILAKDYFKICGDSFGQNYENQIE